jgi:hypothetical protein
MRIEIQMDMMGSIWHVVQVCIVEKRGRERLSAEAMLYKYLLRDARCDHVSDQGRTIERALLGAVGCRAQKWQLS